jgi:glycosyltransferase involved in cell wall biosynthesis
MRSEISVVIPSYNIAGFIAETLDSIFTQTRPPVEVIVVDDCSTDGTPDIVSRIASSSRIPLRLIRSEGNSGGPARPLNRGIAAAAGDLIATMDHDDVMLPCKLERQVDCWEKDRSLGLVFARCTQKVPGRPSPAIDKTTLCGTDRLLRNPIGQGCYRIPASSARDGMIFGNFALTCSNFVFPKRTWEVCNGFDEVFKTSCDYGFLCAVSEHFDLGFVDEALVYWRPREDSLYNSSDNLVKTLERVKVKVRLQNRVPRGERRTILLGEIRQELLGAAYSLRQAGDYRGALRYYLGSIRSGGVSREAFMGLIKLFPHRLLRQRGAYSN